MAMEKGAPVSDARTVNPLSRGPTWWLMTFGGCGLRIVGFGNMIDGARTVRDEITYILLGVAVFAAGIVQRYLRIHPSEPS